MMRQLIRPLRAALRVQQAEDRLRRYVLDGPLKAGDCLPPELELSAQLGVGRSTLREAVRVLESQGLVHRRQGVGVEVIDRSDSAAGEMLALVIERRRASQNDLIEMRRVVELQAARWAATRSTDKDRAAIRGALNDMLVPAISPECFAQADLAFHLAIARAAHNVVLFAMLSAVRGLLYDEIVSTLKPDFRPGTIRDYHAAILEGIDMRDPEGAASAMTEHLAETERKLRLQKSRRAKKGRS